jgi:cold shock CspA family protein
MRYTIKFMEWLLRAVFLALRAALKDDEIKSRIAKYGYNETVLNEGLTLCKKAETLYLSRNVLFGEQYTLSANLRKKLDNLYHYYMKYVKLIRKTLKRDPNALTILGLNTQRPKTMMGLIEKAKQFFQQLLENQDIYNRIKKFTITQETLDEGQRLIDEVEQDKEYQALKISQAQDTTVQRNTTFESLYTWWTEFKQAAINACEDRPQILERMGIVAHADGYKKTVKKEPADTTGNTEPAAAAGTPHIAEISNITQNTTNTTDAANANDAPPPGEK